MDSPLRSLFRSVTPGTLLFAAIGGLALAGGPACEPAASDCVAGTRGCACADDDACVGDLECLSAVCVRADGGETSAAPDDDDDSDSDNDRPDSGDATATGSDPTATPEVCGRLLACLAEVAPDAVPDALDAYGPEGSCWQDQSLWEVCATACASSLSARSVSGDEVCQECTAAPDCGPFEGEHCLLGTCVECTNNGDCPRDRPLCINTTGRPACGTSSCGPAQLACASGECLPAEYFCDGDIDCPTGTDEVNC